MTGSPGLFFKVCPLFTMMPDLAALSSNFADAPAAVVEVKMLWQALTWLADLFYI